MEGTSGSQVELDIVALRSDHNASVEWLDMGYTSTSMWRSSLQEPRRPRLQRRHPIHGCGYTQRRQTCPRKLQVSEDDYGMRITDEEDCHRHSRQSQVELDIVALRTDKNASIEWLDSGLSSTTMWQSLKAAMSAASTIRKSKPARRHGLRGYQRRRQFCNGASGNRGPDEGAMLAQHVAPRLEGCSAAAQEQFSCDTSSDGSTSCPEEDVAKQMPEDVFVRSASVKQCALCQAQCQGFGDVCAACRRYGSKGGVQECRDCSNFFWGFTALCQDCQH